MRRTTRSGLLRRLARILSLATGVFVQTTFGDESTFQSSLSNSEPPRTSVKAFLVGTNEYLGGFKKLQGCAADVVAFREVLASWNVDLQTAVLTSQEENSQEDQVGKVEIEKGFDAFLAGLTSEDVAIVAVSGHGCQIMDENGRLRTYYAPRDARLDNDGKSIVVESLIDLSLMIDRLSTSEAKFKWMIVDACRDTKNDNEAGSGKDLEILPLKQKAFEVNVADTTVGIRENFYLSQSCAAKQISQECKAAESGITRGAYMLSLCEALTDEKNAEREGNVRVVSIEGACSKAKDIIKKYNPAQTPTNTQLQDSSISKFPVKSRITAKIGDVDVEFVWIPQGTFKMGDSKREPIPGSKRNESPTIKVEITRGYWLARTETTNELWAQVMGEELEEGLNPQKPVVGKTWDECKKFIDRLNENEAFLRLFSPGESTAAFEASLPTEAQWERACRAGQEGEVTQKIAGGIRVVGSDDADENPWGLRDMFGNAREWQRDYYENYSDARADDLVDRCGWRNHGYRVVRGASASSSPRVARATQREGVYLDETAADVGFRIALVRKNP